MDDYSLACPPWRHTLDLATELALAVNEAETVDAALSAALERLCRKTGWSVGLGWVPTRDGNRLECRAAYHDQAFGQSTFTDMSRTLQFAPGQGLPGQVWSERRAVWQEGLDEREFFPRAAFAASDGLQTGVGVPAMAGEEVAAVLELFVTERRPADQAFVELISGAGLQLGSFILQKRAEERLRTSEEQFRLIAETAKDAIVTADESNRIAYLNGEAERMFGYPLDEARGEPVTLLMPERYREPHLTGFQRYLATGESEIMGETTELSGRRRDGSEFPIELSLAGGSTAQGRIFTAIIRDITERKEAERAIARALAMEREASRLLRESDETKNTFLHAVSHDLRNPLTAVIGLVSLLDRDDSGKIELTPEDRRDALKRLGSSTRRMNRLIADLLDLDRLEQGAMAANREPMDVGALVGRVVEGIGAGSDHLVELAIEPVLAPVDRAMVERIVENLFYNALRHTPSGTSVWVRVRAQDGGALIVVEDAGPGVPEGLQEKVFAPFTQGERGGSPGMGIGLSLVARFAELHGGRAWLENRPGGGASFHVLLPPADPAGPADAHDSDGASDR